MLPMLSNLYSSESLMAGAGILRDRDRDEQGLGSCGGFNAADDSLLEELRNLQERLSCL